MDVKIDFQINLDANVVEGVSTGASKVAVISGGVFAYDASGGGAVVPLVVEAICGKVDESTKKAISSIVAGFTAKATRGIVVAPTTPKLVQSHWVHSAYNLNMAIYSEVMFGSKSGTFIISPTFLRIGWAELMTTKLEQK
ncbi:hypothetical protein SELMODRAFT_420887 [Selaginella moellendorffii]|uniref:Uncharacterized protein n=1 Tax=Selaginella moellendorffii TaxID=88036 RepID=D8SDF7_SELML|nr:hypothetical protein SELMODRAFT_420887 [Selaginella moellendorffii]